MVTDPRGELIAACQDDGPSLLTFQTDLLMGLGIMLAANEVPRIAQQFGLDSSVKINMMSVVHASTTAVNLSRVLTKPK